MNDTSNQGNDAKNQGDDAKARPRVSLFGGRARSRPAAEPPPPRRRRRAGRGAPGFPV